MVVGGFQFPIEFSHNSIMWIRLVLYFHFQFPIGFSHKHAIYSINFVSPAFNSLSDSHYDEWYNGWVDEFVLSIPYRILTSLGQGIGTGLSGLTFNSLSDSHYNAFELLKPLSYKAFNSLSDSHTVVYANLAGIILIIFQFPIGFSPMQRGSNAT